MTWLLHQLQKVLGVLTGSRRRADNSASTKSEDEDTQLPQNQTSNLDDSIARRVSAADASLPSAETPFTTQSTASLRGENASVLKGTVDPIANEPDTHHRLDAAPAAKPGGASATPSFPSDVSELISSQSVLSPVLKEDSTNDLSVPSIKTPTDEQLPNIHDLLPAVESDIANFSEGEKLPGSDDSDVAEDLSTVESANRVDAVSDQATLFSFDITEADASPTDTDIFEDIDDSAPLESTHGPQSDHTEASIAEPLIKTAESEPEIVEGVNPWLTAKPPSVSPSTEPLFKKQGIVKLLFTLKPGNFHGYIAPQDGSKDILFHQKYINAEIFDELERGSQVVATVKIMEGKAYATHVDLLQE